MAQTRRQRERVARAYAASHGSREERLAIARDPAASAEELSAVAPGIRDEHDVELVTAVLTHPNVPSGVVGRYGTSPHVVLRRLVVEHPLCMPSTLAVMVHDRDAGVAAVARERLREERPGR